MQATSITRAVARTIDSDRHQQTRRTPIGDVGEAAAPEGPREELIIRPARSADAAALERLAALDGASGRPSSGRELVVERDGRLVAAVDPLAPDAPLADPFAPTADAVALLRVRAAQLAPTGGRRRRARSLRRALAT